MFVLTPESKTRNSDAKSAKSWDGLNSHELADYKSGGMNNQPCADVCGAPSLARGRDSGSGSGFVIRGK